MDHVINEHCEFRDHIYICSTAEGLEDFSSWEWTAETSLGRFNVQAQGNAKDAAEAETNARKALIKLRKSIQAAAQNLFDQSKGNK